MFSLLRGFYDFYARKPSFNILIIGLDNAGKTTLLEQLKLLLQGKQMSQTLVPTVGLNVSKCELNGIQCQFWDLGGGADLPKLWSKYYEEAHAVLFVIDSATVGEEERVRKLRKILDEITANEDVEGIPVAILANKQDLITDPISSLAATKEIFNPLMSSIEARESKAFGVSAVTGVGVREALEWVLSAVEKNSDSRPPNFI